MGGWDPIPCQTLIEEDEHRGSAGAMARAHVDATSFNRRATPVSLVKWMALLGYDLVVPDRVQYVAALARQSARKKLYQRRRKRAVWETVADANLRKWAGQEASFTVAETLKNYHGTEGPWEKTVRRAGLARKGTAQALQRRRETDPKFAETWDRIENARKVAYEKIVHAMAKAVVAMSQAFRILMEKTKTRRLEATQKVDEAMQAGKENVNKMAEENSSIIQLSRAVRDGKAKALEMYEKYGKSAVEGVWGRAALLLAAIAPYFSVALSGINYAMSFTICMARQIVSDVRAAVDSM